MSNIQDIEFCGLGLQIKVDSGSAPMHLDLARSLFAVLVLDTEFRLAASRRVLCLQRATGERKHCQEATPQSRAEGVALPCRGFRVKDCIQCFSQAGHLTPAAPLSYGLLHRVRSKQFYKPIADLFTQKALNIGKHALITLSGISTPHLASLKGSIGSLYSSTGTGDC